MTLGPSSQSGHDEATESSQGMKLLTLEYTAERGRAHTERELEIVKRLGTGYLSERTQGKKRKVDIENCLKPSQPLPTVVKRNDLTLRAAAAILGSDSDEVKGLFLNAKASYGRLREEASRRKMAAISVIHEISYPALATKEGSNLSYKHEGGKLGQLDAALEGVSLVQMVEIDGLQRLRELLAANLPGPNTLTMPEMISILEDYELPESIDEQESLSTPATKSANDIGLFGLKTAGMFAPQRHPSKVASRSRATTLGKRSIAEAVEKSGDVDMDNAGVEEVVGEDGDEEGQRRKKSRTDDSILTAEILAAADGLGMDEGWQKYGALAAGMDKDHNSDSGSDLSEPPETIDL